MKKSILVIIAICTLSIVACLVTPTLARYETKINVGSNTFIASGGSVSKNPLEWLIIEAYTDNSSVSNFFKHNKDSKLTLTSTSSAWSNIKSYFEAANRLTGSQYTITMYSYTLNGRPYYDVLMTQYTIIHLPIGGVIRGVMKYDSTARELSYGYSKVEQINTYGEKSAGISRDGYVKEGTYQ